MFEENETFSGFIALPVNTSEHTTTMKSNFGIKKGCSYCHKDVKMLPAQSIDGTLRFCDLVCAKLYYDNVERFRFDYAKYNNYYNEGELSKKAKDIYEKCRFLMFEQLPVYVPLPSDPAYNDPELQHKVYEKILTPVLFKSIGAYE